MCQAVDSRVETADTVAQSLRQHWDYPVGQIDAVPASPRFAIQRTCGFYVGSDIGNVHAEAPTGAGLFNLNCVIEIPCIIRIDCNDEFFAQIFATLELP